MRCFAKVVVALFAGQLLACNGDEEFFASLRAEDVTATTATIRAETPRPASCGVHYGLATDALDGWATDAHMDGRFHVEHEVILEGLTPGSTYYYQAEGAESDAVAVLSEIGSFRTIAAGNLSEENVALASAGTTVMAVSSNFGAASNDSTWGVDNAIDGILSTEWATDGDGDAAFVELDLGVARELTGFGFRSRKMADNTSVVEKVQLTLLPAGTLVGFYDTPDPDVDYRFDITPPVTTQRVRVDAVQTTGGNTGAKEIRLFSKK